MSKIFCAEFARSGRAGAAVGAVAGNAILFVESGAVGIGVQRGGPERAGGEVAADENPAAGGHGGTLAGRARGDNKKPVG